ncbi:hypothetical protein D3C83_69290 [compost metagenome]
MAADHSIEPAALGLAHHRVLEITDEAHRPQDIALGVVRERPVTAHSDLAPDPRQEPVQVHEHGI